MAISVDFTFYRNLKPAHITFNRCYSDVTNDEYWYSQIAQPFYIDGYGAYKRNDYLIWNNTQKQLIGLPERFFGLHFNVLE